MRALGCVLVVALSLIAADGPDEFATSAGVVKVTPINHASLILQGGGQTIYVDPVGEQKYQGSPPADLILITDTHGDHLDQKAIARLRKPATRIIAPEAAASSLNGATVLANGARTSIGRWTIEAVPMYNLKRGPAPGKLYHEKGRGNGYVLTLGDKRFYISGDTEGIPEMKALKDIDVAFVCMNLPYTMPPEEAAEAVRAFKPRVVYPYHYRGSDLNVFSEALEGTGIDVRIRDWYAK